jgi:hypothetical protein
VLFWASLFNYQFSIRRYAPPTGSLKKPIPFFALFAFAVKKLVFIDLYALALVIPAIGVDTAGAYR